MLLHITKTGQRVLLCQMTDDHLKDTIKLHCNKILGLRQMLDNGHNRNDVTMIYTGISKVFDPEEIRDNIRNIVELLKDYTFEASLRSLDVSKELQEAIGRKEKSLMLDALTMSE